MKLKSPPSRGSRPGPSIEPHFRQLKAYIAVAEQGGIHRAARYLNLSQSSLTKAIQKLEAQVGYKLFDRTHVGMIPTEHGRILARRALRALQHIRDAETEIHALERVQNEIRAKPFAPKVTNRQLVALIGVADYHSETAAAENLIVSQPALTVALRELERLAGHALFVRTARGMIATGYGEILARRAKLAFSEIGAIASDVSAHLGVVRGRVVLGALPLSGALLGPRAVKLLVEEHPGLKVSVIDGTYQALLQGLRCGEIDAIVGALSAPMSEMDIAHEKLFEDSLSLVVRKGHPLSRKRALTLRDLKNVQWVLPRPETPARIRLDRVMNAANVSYGVNPIESNALLAMRTLLMESDRIGVITRNQIYFDELADLLEILPLELPDTSLAIGIRTRNDAILSIGVQSLLRHLRAIGEKISHDSFRR